MDFLLTKLLPLALYPLGSALGLLLLGFIALRIGWRRVGWSLSSIALVYLWVMSTPRVGNALLLQLEQTHPPIAVAQTPRADAAIILGGVVGYLAPPRVYPDLNSNAGRIVHGARLFQSGRVSTLIITGGNYPWGPDSPSEAEQIADLLVEWGVPRAAIHLETESLNTRQNAVNTKALMTELGIKSSLLVTSGFHMPRALATFQAAGLEPYPVTSGIKALKRDFQFPLDYLPQESGLSATTMVIKEWLGMAVYGFRGWM